MWPLPHLPTHGSSHHTAGGEARGEVGRAHGHECTRQHPVLLAFVEGVLVAGAQEAVRHGVVLLVTMQACRGALGPGEGLTQEAVHLGDGGAGENHIKVKMEGVCKARRQGDGVREVDSLS